MSFFIIVFIIHTLVNIYIFYRGWKAFPKSPYVRILYALIFFIFYSSFATMMLGRNHFPLDIQKIFYFLGTSWLAVMLYITLYFLFTDLIYLLNKCWHFIPAQITSSVYHRMQIISGYGVVLILLLVGYQKFTHPTIVEKEISIDKSGGEYRELKILAFSDLHLGVTIDKKKLHRYIHLINEQKPDMIMIAGDLIDNNLYPLWEEKMYEELNQLQAPLGIYYCLGNHEYLSGIDKSLEFIKKTKLTLLRDQAIQINKSFWVLGRDDNFNKNRQALNTFVTQTDTAQPLFLLDHQPYHLKDTEVNDIDLQFSGHTHHGQLWPINLMVDKIFEVGYGYKLKGNTHIYVSSGLALWGPEYRIGTQSEVVIFRIKFN